MALPWQTTLATAILRGHGVSSYLLLDEFTATASAPLATPRTCEPGPGTLDLSTATGWTIANGALTTFGLAAQSAVSGAAWMRAVGLAALFSTTYTAGGANYCVSFSERNTIGVDKAMPSYPAFASTYANYNTQTEFALVLTTFGTLWINRTTNKLVWVDVTGALDKNLCVQISSGDDSWAMDYLRVAQLGAPYNTDYGLATNRITAPTNPQATTSAANAIVAFTWIPAAAEVLELDVRRTDADNRWIVRCDQANSTITLIERNAAVETARRGVAQTWTVGTGYYIAAAMDGDSIQMVVNGGAADSVYTSASFNNTATGVNVAGFATGGDLITWPRDISAYPIELGKAVSTTYTPIPTRTPVAPPGSVPAGTICASPTGSAAGDGSPANPYDFATGMANLTDGGTLLLLDGIYQLAPYPAMTYFGKENATLQTTVKAQTGARPILTATNGNVIFPRLRRWTTVDGLWFGGVRGGDGELQNENDCIVQNCTFFNHLEAINDGTTARNQYLNNRFVNCGNGALAHDIYINNTNVAPGEGPVVRGGIHVGGEGYKIQLWHDPKYATVQNNFCATGNSGYCIVIQGDGHTADHNTCWNGWMQIADQTNSVIQNNVVGPNTFYTGSLGAGSIARNNVSTYPAALFGAMPTQWLRNSWKVNTGYSVDEINAAVKKLELAFEQTAANIWQDNGIEPLFTILAAVRDAGTFVDTNPISVPVPGASPSSRRRDRWRPHHAHRRKNWLGNHRKNK